MRKPVKLLATFQGDGSIYLELVEEPVATTHDVLFSTIHIHDAQFPTGVYIAKDNIVGDKLTKAQTDRVIKAVHDYFSLQK